MSDIPRSRRPAPIAQRLRAPLEQLYADFDYAGRVERDAIRFPLRYADPRDREVVALLTGVSGLRPGGAVRRCPGDGAGRHGTVAGALHDGVRARAPRSALLGVSLPLQSAARRRGLLRGGAPDPRAPRRPGSVLPRGRSRPHRGDRSRDRGLRAGLSRGRPRRGVPAGPSLPRVPSPLSLALGGWPLQAAASVPALDGAARTARLRSLDSGVAGAAPRARRHPCGEHESRHRTHAPAIANLEDGGGDHRPPGRHRSRRPRQVRLRPVPQADVGRLPRPS